MANRKQPRRHLPAVLVRNCTPKHFSKTNRQAASASCQNSTLYTQTLFKYYRQALAHVYLLYLYKILQLVYSMLSQTEPYLQMELGRFKSLPLHILHALLYKIDLPLLGSAHLDLSLPGTKGWHSRLCYPGFGDLFALGFQCALSRRKAGDGNPKR